MSPCHCKINSGYFGRLKISYDRMIIHIDKYIMAGNINMVPKKIFKEIIDSMLVEDLYETNFLYDNGYTYQFTLELRSDNSLIIYSNSISELGNVMSLVNYLFNEI